MIHSPPSPAGTTPYAPHPAATTTKPRRHPIFDPVAKAERDEAVRKRARDFMDASGSIPVERALECYRTLAQEFGITPEWVRRLLPKEWRPDRRAITAHAIRTHWERKREEWEPPAPEAPAEAAPPALVSVPVDAVAPEIREIVEEGWGNAAAVLQEVLQFRAQVKEVGVVLQSAKAHFEQLAGDWVASYLKEHDFRVDAELQATRQELAEQKELGTMMEQEIATQCGHIATLEAELQQWREWHQNLMGVFGGPGGGLSRP